jgi:TPR repeat protein
LKAASLPTALHNLGWLYEEGYTESGKPDYQKATDYYRQAATMDSFGNLGRLYMNGLVGKIEGIPDYRTAVEYLELSGNPNSLCNLGSIRRGT